MKTCKSGDHQYEPTGSGVGCPQCNLRRTQAYLIKWGIRVKNSRAAKRATPEYRAKVRAYRLKYLYDLTPEEWEKLFESQGRKCANFHCGATIPGANGRWATDHDHVTNKVRGILCYHCNVALGLVKDCPNRLLGLVSYLEDRL